MHSTALVKGKPCAEALSGGRVVVAEANKARLTFSNFVVKYALVKVAAAKSPAAWLTERIKRASSVAVEGHRYGWMAFFTEELVGR